MLRCSTNQQTKLERLDKVNCAGVLTLLFARIIYAIIWFNIASIFSHIASDFKEDVSMLGLITASFFVGIGIFQVPGGILAPKQGSKKTATYGMTIASLPHYFVVYLHSYNR